MTNNLHASECFVALDTEGLEALPASIQFTDKDDDLWTVREDGLFSHPFYGTVTSEWLGEDDYSPYVIENPNLLGEFFSIEHVTVEDMAGLRALPVGAILSPGGNHPFRKTAERYEWFDEDSSWGAHGLNEGTGRGSPYLPAILTNPEILGEFYPPHGIEVGYIVRLVEDVDCYGLRAGELLVIQQIREPVVGTDFGIDFANDTTDGELERGFLARFEFEVVEEPLADWGLELLNGFDEPCDTLIYKAGDRVMVDYSAQSESARRMWNGPATVTHDYDGNGSVRVQPDGHKYVGAFFPSDVSPLVETEPELPAYEFSYEELTLLTEAISLLAKASGATFIVSAPGVERAA